MNLAGVWAFGQQGQLTVLVGVLAAVRRRPGASRALIPGRTRNRESEERVLVLNLDGMGAKTRTNLDGAAGA